jgi:NTE family protein
MSFALVLAGGGITGAAWEAGILKGLRDVGTDLSAADLIIGTSAGAMVGAVVAAGQLDALYERQIGPVDSAVERAAVVDFAKFANALSASGTSQKPAAEISQSVRARLGQLALAAEVDFTEEDRLRTMASRLGFDSWPERSLMITAVACDDGALIIWTKDSGVPLVAAVASSCAAPFVYPPTTIAGRRYMDGGMRSGANADLAHGSRRIVVITPGGASSSFGGALTVQIEALRGQGAKVAVIEPDADAVILGPGALDPARRRAAAEVGYKQAAAVVGSLSDVVTV